MKRKNERFKEKRNDDERKISVTFIQQFSPLKTYFGKLFDLSDHAVKVLVDKKYEEDILNYMPKAALTKFRFSSQHKVAVSVSSIRRIDNIVVGEPDKIGIVLYFDVLSKEDQVAIKEIIAIYG